MAAEVTALTGKAVVKPAKIRTTSLWIKLIFRKFFCKFLHKHANSVFATSQLIRQKFPPSSLHICSFSNKTKTTSTDQKIFWREFHLFLAFPFFLDAALQNAHEVRETGKPQL